LQEISKIAEGDVGDPRLEFVTFTEVRMTSDLRYAQVFFSSLGDESARDEAGAALGKAKGYIRRELGRRLRLRHVPELRFLVDDSSQVADRIGRLIDRTERSSGDADEE
jgi:ribosome-binding factor A